MKRDYLGDSYDAVKRLWQKFSWIAHHCTLIHGSFQKAFDGEFTRLTGISMLPDSPQQPYSILNDPDTGIRLPGENNQRESRVHIALPRIRKVQRPRLRCVITFDQSDYRPSELKRDQQRHSKMRFLAEAGLFRILTMYRMRLFSSPFPTPRAGFSFASDCRPSESLMTALRQTSETVNMRCSELRVRSPMRGLKSDCRLD